MTTTTTIADAIKERASADMLANIDPSPAARTAAAAHFRISSKRMDDVITRIYRTTRNTIKRGIEDAAEETGLDREVLAAVVWAEVEWSANGD